MNKVQAVNEDIYTSDSYVSKTLDSNEVCSTLKKLLIDLILIYDRDQIMIKMLLGVTEEFKLEGSSEVSNNIAYSSLCKLQAPLFLLQFLQFVSSLLFASKLTLHCLPFTRRVVSI